MGQGTSLGGRLEERYFLQKVKLGQGSFGSVHRAIDRETNRTVAIKQLDKKSLPSRGVRREDIEREIKMMQACKHENITELYDTYEDDSSIYLALEYCDGGDFGDKVKERGLAASEGEVAEWVRQMCAAITAMHVKGICHRDVKPDNFMVQDVGVLKLSDFGLAIYVPKGKLLQEKCGTPAFMSPEQHKLPRWSSGYSFPADMWACGVSMYMMMFGGKHPFLTDRGGLDEALLMAGELDLRDTRDGNLGGFFNFAGWGGAPLRFSEEGRLLCKRLVEPDPGKRMTAEETALVAWLQHGRGSAEAAAAAAAGVAGVPPVRPLPSPSRAATPPPAPQEARQSSPLALPSPERRRPAGPAAALKAAGAVAAGGAAAAVAAAGGAMEAWGAAPGASAPTAEERQRQLELELANQALTTELESRKRREEELKQREEELLQAQRHMQMKQKILERRRTKELEEAKKLSWQKEQEMQAMQEEMQKLERLRSQQVSRSSAPPHLPSGSPTAAGTAPPTLPAAQHTATAAKAASLPSRWVPLQPGAKCMYESASYGWMTAVIKCYNEAEGTYTLDVKQHVPAEKISPMKSSSAAEAWPNGTTCSYLSASVDRWLPAAVLSFNEGDGTYNLDVRDHADVERIRAIRAPEGGDARARPRLTTQHTQMLQDGGPSATARREGGDGKKATYRLSDLEATAAVARVASPSPAAAPRWVNKGDYCLVAQHGLVLLDSVVGRDGCYVAVVQRDRKRVSVKVEDMRAPKEEKFAWPPGTQVSYLSASVGKWMNAAVQSFNTSSSTYNLDVRQEADADKIRPR